MSIIKIYAIALILLSSYGCAGMKTVEGNTINHRSGNVYEIDKSFEQTKKEGGMFSVAATGQYRVSSATTSEHQFTKNNNAADGVKEFIVFTSVRMADRWRNSDVGWLEDYYFYVPKMKCGIFLKYGYSSGMDSFTYCVDDDVVLNSANPSSYVKERFVTLVRQASSSHEYEK